jgi:NAD-binding of NADP-dependent 3-hydroxyisobutyrate dehydrogenase
VLKQSAAASKIMDQKGYRMVRKQFLPAAGKTSFYYKDVRLMLALGARLDCPLPLISLHAQALASEIAKGRADWDSANIISFYDELANLGSPQQRPDSGSRKDSRAGDSLGVEFVRIENPA